MKLQTITKKALQSCNFVNNTFLYNSTGFEDVANSWIEAIHNKYQSTSLWKAEGNPTSCLRKVHFRRDQFKIIHGKLEIWIVVYLSTLHMGPSINDVTPNFQFFDHPPSPCHPASPMALQPLEVTSPWTNSMYPTPPIFVIRHISKIAKIHTMT